MTRDQGLMVTAATLLATGGWGACGSDQEFEAAAQKAMARAIRLGEYAKFSEGISAYRFEREVQAELTRRAAARTASPDNASLETLREAAAL